ncbi:AAA family ATPase, partial [Ectothiorhodospira shaposhnikovii]|uniref:AAA family ATPase n=1 Tax=Ectothiorhodospira shaposhnikovii TaxID=1054 RepID=UPI001EE812F3
MATQLNLPIGVQSLAEIINEGYYYVDKTPWLHRLIKEGKYYFLSRPRRFGKSLLLDTLKELFEANEPLFRGLYIHDRWDWQTRHPVVRISFADGVMQTRDTLDARIRHLLALNRKRLNIDHSGAPDIAGEFSDLIRMAHQ